jgi:ribosomal protein L30E
MAGGYILLHRQILDSYQFSNPEYLKIWIWMLAKANYKSKVANIEVNSGRTDVPLERGQFIFGRTSAAKELKMGESKIYRVLKKFESDGSITVKSNNKFSVITVCKYDTYNCAENENEQPVNSQRTASEQPVNTTNKENKGKERIKKEKKDISEPTASDSTYPLCISIYDAFIQKQTGVKANINGMAGSAMKKIIVYLRAEMKRKGNVSDDIPASFKLILDHFHLWQPFHQQQLNLNQIESNLINIIAAIKNGIPTNNSKQYQRSKYAPQE